MTKTRITAIILSFLAALIGLVDLVWGGSLENLLMSTVSTGEIWSMAAAVICLIIGMVGGGLIFKHPKVSGILLLGVGLVIYFLPILFGVIGAGGLFILSGVLALVSTKQKRTATADISKEKRQKIAKNIRIVSVVLSILGILWGIVVFTPCLIKGGEACMVAGGLFILFQLIDLSASIAGLFISLTVTTLFGIAVVVTLYIRPKIAGSLMFITGVLELIGFPYTIPATILLFSAGVLTFIASKDLDVKGE